MSTLEVVGERASTTFAEEAIEHIDILYRGALRMTRFRVSAEDLVQDTYARALRYQNSYQAGTNMRAWLFAIMRNLFWDRFRGKHSSHLSLDGDGEHSLYELLEDENAGPEEVALDRLAHAEVIEAVDALPELHREVVVMVDVEGLSYRDTAEVLGVPIGTVMSRLYRARQQLQHALARYAQESGISTSHLPSPARSEESTGNSQ